MLHLRLVDGLNLQTLESIFGVSKQLMIAKSEKYVTHQLAKLERDHLSLTPKGFLVSNAIILDLLQNVIIQ